MAEISRVWGGSVTGDAGPYTLDHWSDIWDSLFNRRVANGGVLRGDRGELATTGTVSPVTTQAGTALVNGTWYDNNAAINTAISTPGGATRVDLIVLRKSWAAQTIRLTRVAGVEGSGAPALTQSAGVTWDIPLAQVSITTGGVITVTDTRIFATFATQMAQVCEGRLTLTTLTPVTTADVTAATTIFWTPYKGNRIALYDGSVSWNILTFPETSLALNTLTLNLPYDVFAYNNAGVVTLEFLAWTSITTRATNLVLQDGVLVKSGATTRRYLGTFYTQTTTTTEDSKSRRLLWNYYNRVPRYLTCQDNTASWTYNTATWRAANANTTDGTGRVACVIGWAEDAIEARNAGNFSSTQGASQDTALGIGVDSTSVNSALYFGAPVNSSAIPQSISEYVGVPAVGYHFLQRLEITTVTATTTFYGQKSATVQSAMTAKVMA